jgi:hypothetical protein
MIGAHAERPRRCSQGRNYRVNGASLASKRNAARVARAEEEMVMRRIMGYWSFCGVMTLAAMPERAVAENLTCSERAPRLIDDFEDGDTTTPDGSGGWYVGNDGTGIQEPSQVTDLVVAGGREPSDFAARTAGEDFADWGAVAGVVFGCARSVDGFNGLRFAIQSETSSVFDVKLLTLATQSEDNGGDCTEGCNDHFAVPLSLADTRWFQCSVRFADLAQQCFGTPVDLDTDSVTGVELFFPAGSPFDVTFDDLTFENDVTQTGCVALEPQLQCE